MAVEKVIVELDPAMFGIEPNVGVMHQVVNAQLAARRAGTHKTKTRGEVRGGGAKPWKQKGTGRARAGSTRSPIWVGGGVAHGPVPRDYSQRTNKKMKSLALRSALSDRAAESRVVVVADWGIDAPSTKQAKQALVDLGVDGKALIVLDRQNDAVWKSLRNLPDVHLLAGDQLNTYDVLVSDFVVFDQSQVPTTSVAAEQSAVAPESED